MNVPSFTDPLPGLRPSRETEHVAGDEVAFAFERVGDGLLAVEDLPVAMPSDERVRLHDCEEATPVDQPRQRDEHNPRRIIGAARLHLALHVPSQLLSQEQILGCEVGMRSCRRREQPQDVRGDAQDGSDRGAGTRLGHGRRIVCEHRRSS